MYGQTEATARMTYLPYKMSRKKIGSVGIPIDGGKIYLANDKSKNDKKGEIIYEGKNVSMGYAKNFQDLNKIFCQEVPSAQSSIKVTVNSIDIIPRVPDCDFRVVFDRHPETSILDTGSMPRILE